MHTHTRKVYAYHTGMHTVAKTVTTTDTNITRDTNKDTKHIQTHAMTDALHIKDTYTYSSAYTEGIPVFVHEPFSIN